jgi:hypothetical protein
MSTPAGGGGGYDAANSVLNANFVLSNSSSEQNAFPAGQVTLAVTASTYRFHGMYLIGTGTTSKTTATGFTLAGGAVVSSFEYVNLVWLAAANAITTTQSTKHTSGVAAAAQDGGGAYARVCMWFHGIARFTTGGTITLRLKFSVAPGTTCQMLSGSYIEFVKLGAYDYIKTGTWT